MNELVRYIKNQKREDYQDLRIYSYICISICHEKMSQSLRGRLFRLSPQLFGTEVKLNEFLEEHVSSAKVVILGEFHGESSIIELQTLIQNKLADSLLLKPLPFSHDKSSGSSLPSIGIPNTVSCDSGASLNSNDTSNNDMETIATTASPKVRVVMEHFSLEMQQILDLYQTGNLNVLELKEVSYGTNY